MNYLYKRKPPEKGPQTYDVYELKDDFLKGFRIYYN